MFIFKRKKTVDWEKLDAMIAEWKYWRTHNYTWPKEPEPEYDYYIGHSILFTDKCPTPLFTLSTINEEQEEYE